jgi:hypothetical protein
VTPLQKRPAEPFELSLDEREVVENLLEAIVARGYDLTVEQKALLDRLHGRKLDE